MTLEQLRIFVAVAEKQHVTQAAGELNLTQSATSAAIAALEARYGIKLFDRIGRGVVLTQTGRDFLIEARDRRELVPQDMMTSANNYLRQLAGSEGTSLADERVRTYATYLLTRQGVVTSNLAFSRWGETLGDDVVVLVDYAHTPDALERALASVRPTRVISTGRRKIGRAHV